LPGRRGVSPRPRFLERDDLGATRAPERAEFGQAAKLVRDADQSQGRAAPAAQQIASFSRLGFGHARMIAQLRSPVLTAVKTPSSR
jgi:hypothetical protein